MRVIDDGREDRFGKTYIQFPKSATIPEIHEWLEAHYHGYAFAIVLDETKDEYEPIDEVVVNFFQDLADEAVQANGDFKAVPQREYMKIIEYLQKNGTTWSEVVNGHH